MNLRIDYEMKHHEERYAAARQELRERRRLLRRLRECVEIGVQLRRFLIRHVGLDAVPDDVHAPLEAVELLGDGIGLGKGGGGLP